MTWLKGSSDQLGYISPIRLALHLGAGKKISRFTRDLSLLLRAKLSLTASLSVLQAQARDEYSRCLVGQIMRNLQKGNSFAESIERSIGEFDTYYVNMVRVGELTGNLGEMLWRVSEYKEKIIELKRKLIQASVYPILVLLVATAATSFLLLYVVPTFAGIFRDFDGELPAITRMILGLSAFLQEWGGWLGLMLVASFVILRMMSQREDVGLVFDRIVFRLPVLGSIIAKNHIAQLCRTLGSLLKSRIPLLQALRITIQSSENRQIRKELQQMRRLAQKGKTLTQGLGGSVVFPAMVVQMIAVGEETAELPKMLMQVAEGFEKDLDVSIELLSTVIEPVLILLLGGIIGVILVSIYLPLFNLVTIIQ